MNDLYVFHRVTDFVGNQLGKCGFFALSVWRCADHCLDFSNRRHAHNRALPQTTLETNRARYLAWAEAADFRIRGNADTQVAAIGTGSLLLLAEVFVAQDRQRFI